jgi:hypothetical protein
MEGQAKQIKDFCRTLARAAGAPFETPEDAHAEKKCMVCGLPVNGRIYSVAGEREYAISGTCELCFDKLFEEED